MRKVLVTTALEETWPEDPQTPVLFLGEWCRLYSRKDRWSAMNAEVLPYHWDDRQKLYADYLYIREFYERVLAKLGVTLNEIHDVDHSPRYWRILIGPWLGWFLQMCFDRWSSLQQVLNTQTDFETTIVEYPLRTMIPQNMGDFVHFFATDQWNHCIYAKIINELYKNRIKLNYIKGVNSLNKNIESTVKLHSKVLGYCFDKTKFLSKTNQVFMIGTYLPPLLQWRLDLKLGQVPQWNYLIEPENTEFDQAIRNNKLDLVGQNIYEEFVERILFDQLLVIYLEGYSKLQKKLEENPWPKSPKVIFSSNPEIGNDYYKAYAAAKVERGSKLVIGQHGGHYGVGLWSFTEDHHLAIADKYFSWGWLDPAVSKIVPIGQLKNKKPIGIDHFKNHRLLLVTSTMPRYSYHMYSATVSRQWLDYLEDQFSFCKTLSDEVRQRLKVRLYAQDYGWDQVSRWQDRFPEIELDEGKTSMLERINECRIYVSTYNATTYLESFTMNVPTVIFWNPNHWEIRKSAKPYFEALEEVGLFHTTPESAAKHVSEIWNDVNSWWYSNSVQEVVEEFKQQYSRVPAKLLGKIHRELTELRESTDSSA